MTLLKGQVKYSCAEGRFEKRVKAEFNNVKLHIVFTGIKYFSGGIFLKPMLIRVSTGRQREGVFWTPWKYKILISMGPFKF